MKTLQNRLSLTFLAASLAGSVCSCDPVRPGDYRGDSPAPLRVQIPGDAFKGQDGNLWLDVRVLRDNRNWLRFYPSPDARADLGSHTELAFTGWLDFAASLDSWNALQPPPPSNNPVNVAFGIIDLRSMGGVNYSSPWQLSAVAPNYLLVVSNQDRSVLPFGPSGASLDVKRGFQLFHRTCDPVTINHLESVPLDTVLEQVPLPTHRPDLANSSGDLVPRSVKPSEEDYDDFVTTCGITLPTAQLGQPAQVQRKQPVMSFAWAPKGDMVYFISGEPTLMASTPPNDKASNTVMSLDPVSFKTAVVSQGMYFGPLQVATGGSSLIAYSYRVSPPNHILMTTTRIALSSALLPVVATWGFASPEVGPVFTKWPDHVLSPDGNTLATRQYAVDDIPISTGGEFLGVHLIDVATATSHWLPNSIDCPDSTPLAWAPNGRTLLVDCRGLAGVATVGLDGTVTSIPPANLLNGGYYHPDPYTPYAFVRFWSASGPQELIQDAAGVRVYNFSTHQNTLLVGPERVAAQTAPTQAVVGTDQVFAWAVQCFGVGETMCTAELRRLSIETGAVDVVATAPEPLRFSVSPDGSQVVFADDSNIYVKELTP